jgi:hypothetical protein
MTKTETDSNATQAQSADGRNVPPNGAINDGVKNDIGAGAVVVTVTVTFTEFVPSSVTDDFESVQVAFVGAPAHAN